jgi:hypothetical protein
MALAELDALDKVVDAHSDFPVEPDFSKGWARSISRRCETLQIKVPLVIRRFMDRAIGTTGTDGQLDKISRDFHGKDYRELSQQQQGDVDSLHSKLWNPAGTSEYLKSGLTFGEAYDLKLEAYRAENDKTFTQEIRSTLNDFARGLERDLQEAAKAGGFFDQFSKADKALRTAVATNRR